MFTRNMLKRRIVCAHCIECFAALSDEKHNIRANIAMSRSKVSCTTNVKVMQAEYITVS